MEDAFVFYFLFGTKQFLLRVPIEEIFSNRDYLHELGIRLIQRHKIPIKYCQGMLYPTLTIVFLFWSKRILVKYVWIIGSLRFQTCALSCLTL